MSENFTVTKNYCLMVLDWIASRLTAFAKTKVGLSCRISNSHCEAVAGWRGNPEILCRQGGTVRSLMVTAILLLFDGAYWIASYLVVFAKTRMVFALFPGGIDLLHPLVWGIAENDKGTYIMFL